LGEGFFQRSRQRLDLITNGHPNVIRVKFLEGISHAFLQMMAFLPEAIKRQKPSVPGSKNWLKMLLLLLPIATLRCPPP
jgi:hypothetical protein